MAALLVHGIHIEIRGYRHALLCTAHCHKCNVSVSGGWRVHRRVMTCML